MSLGIDFNELRKNKKALNLLVAICGTIMLYFVYKFECFLYYLISIIFPHMILSILVSYIIINL